MLFLCPVTDFSLLFTHRYLSVELHLYCNDGDCRDREKAARDADCRSLLYSSLPSKCQWCNSFVFFVDASFASQRDLFAGHKGSHIFLRYTSMSVFRNCIASCRHSLGRSIGTACPAPGMTVRPQPVAWATACTACTVAIVSPSPTHK
jgi:hypothetical protein